MSEIVLSLPRLALAAILLLIAVVLSFRGKLDLERALLWGALRGAVQLIAVGYGLTLLFHHASGWIVLATLGVMTVVAALTSSRRVEHGPARLRMFPGALVAIVVAATVALVPVFAFVIPLDPWFDARYVVPIAGIVLSSAMNVVALVFDRLFAAAVSDADQIETLLSCGATPEQAVHHQVRSALRAALTPTINGLLTVGLVALPGMMTGQIVSGTDPSQAVRYQIVVLYQLVAVGAVAGAVSAMFARRMLFDNRGRLQRDWAG